MPSHLFRIEKLEKIEGEDRTTQAVLARFGIETINKVKDRHILVARNQQKSKCLGLLIAEYSQRTTIKITYIHVKTMWRRLSIGQALLKRLEQDCMAKGIKTITATFDQQNHAMNALTKSQKGWSDGERLSAYTFKSRSAMEPILRKLERTMDDRTKQTEIRALSECNPQDIINASKINHVPQWAQLNTTNLSTAIADLSRVFIQNNQIIGWLITFPLPDETLDYRILWIKEDHRKTGIAIRALTAIIRQAHFQNNVETVTAANNLGNPWPKGFFTMHSKNQVMINFVNKRLAQGTNQRNSLIYRDKLIK